MKLKKPRSSWDAMLAIATAPTTKVTSGPRLTDRQKFDQEQQEELAQELQNSLAPHLSEMSKAYEYATDSMAQYWSQPSVSRIAADLQKGKYFPDLIVDFPKTEQAQGGQYGRDQYVAFLDTLPQSGFVLSELGKQRLLMYGLSNALGNHADMGSPTFWQKAFDRLLELRAFEYKDSTELGYDADQRVEMPEPAAPPARELTIADLENIPTHTREGEAAARLVIADSVFGPRGEGTEVWKEWIQHLRTIYGFDPTSAQQEVCVKWFERNAKSFLRGESYNECRRAMTRNGTFPPNMLTDQERLSEEIERTDSRSFGAKMTLAQKLNLLNASTKR